MKPALVVLALAVCLLGIPAPSPARAQPAAPKLVVVLVVDQMRADYLERYAGLLEHGLKRLTTGGAWYRNAAYPYLTTLTCVGHSTIATGTMPYKHGMISNAWFDRESGKSVTCNADPEATTISYGSTPPAAGPGDSAVHMMAPTLAEVMRGAMKSRVATMSIKPRSAIGLAGHGGDFVTWLGSNGAWATSTAFTKAPVPWFVGYLKGNPIDRDANKVWERSLPAERYQYQDDGQGEQPGPGWTAKFPHPLGPGGDAVFFQHWLSSPYADTYLEQMAEGAVDEMHLGTEERTDFLGVSFSVVDTVGHAFGPRSHEIQDVIVRLDASIGRLLEFLDKKVGADKYVLALSADHGVADIPEQIQNSGRVTSASVIGAAETAMKHGLGEDGPFIAAVSGSDFYLKTGVYDRLKAKPAALKATLAAIAALPGVARVLTSDDVAPPAARTSNDGVIRAAALSYFAGRSGDLLVVPKENWVLVAAGTTHGTLYSYDQRVPVIFYGAGIQPASLQDAATPADIAPTLASIAGVQLPSPDGHVLSAALKKQ